VLGKFDASLTGLLLEALLVLCTPVDVGAARVDWKLDILKKGS
jgi:hypothetical protein